MKIMNKFYTLIFTFLFSIFEGDVGFSKGQPTEWQMGFQEAASPLMAELAGLHDFVFWIITFYHSFCVCVVSLCLF